MGRELTSDELELVSGGDVVVGIGWRVQGISSTMNVNFGSMRYAQIDGGANYYGFTGSTETGSDVDEEDEEVCSQHNDQPDHTEALTNLAILGANSISSQPNFENQEFGYAILFQDGHYSLSPLITSGSSSTIQQDDFFAALDGTDAQIIGIIHNHPAIVPSYLITARDANIQNNANIAPSVGDFDAGDIISQEGYNVAPDLVLFIIGPDGVLRAFDGGNVETVSDDHNCS